MFHCVGPRQNLAAALQREQPARPLVTIGGVRLLLTSY